MEREWWGRPGGGGEGTGEIMNVVICEGGGLREVAEDASCFMFQVRVTDGLFRDVRVGVSGR